MNPFKVVKDTLVKFCTEGIQIPSLSTKNRTSLRDLHPDRIAEELEQQRRELRTLQPLGPPPGYEDPSLSRQATSTPGIPLPSDNIEREAQRIAYEENRIREAYEPLIGQPINDQTRAEVEAVTANLVNRGHQITDVSLNPDMPMTGLATNTSITREYPPLYHNNNPARAILPAQPVDTQGDQTMTGITTFPVRSARSCQGCTHGITDNIYCEACDRGIVIHDRPLGALPLIDRFITKENRDYLYNEWKEKVTKKIKEKARQEILDEMKKERKVIKSKTLSAIIKSNDSRQSSLNQ